MKFSSDLIHDAAVLSSKVYDEVFPESDGKEEGFWNGWRLMSWQELGFESNTKFRNDFLYDALNVQAFVATRGNELAIVFRGTETDDILGKIADLAVDLVLPFSIRGQMDALGPLITVFKQHAVAFGASNAYAFGHSLGGALAEAFMNDSPSSLYSAITFGSPGIPKGSGTKDPRVLNIGHDQDPVVDPPPLVNPTGESFEVSLPLINPYPNGSDNFISEHEKALYTRTAELIEQSGLYRFYKNQAVVVLNNSDNNYEWNSEAKFVMGGDGVDTLTGGQYRDLIAGGAGQDILIGAGDVDRLSGGAGNDTLLGGKGDDELYGGEDNDFLYGGIDIDFYYIAQSGGGIDTITDEDGKGFILLDGKGITGIAIPVTGGTGSKQLYEIKNNNVKLEYDTASQVLTVYDWNGRGTSDRIIINEFDSGELNISLAATTIEPTPPPTPTPKPSVLDPSTDGSSDALLSVQAVNKTITTKTKIPLSDLFPRSGWIDNDGVKDIVSFAVADRTPGGGFLEVSGEQAETGKVHEFPISNIVNWYFVAGPGASVDEIGFNIIQANGDWSPRLEPGAIVTTIVPTDPDPKPIDPGTKPAPTGGGSNLAVLSFGSTSTGASSGGSVEVTYTVKNIGDKTSAKGKADIVLATTPDLLSGRRIGDDFNIPELKPGEERTYTRTVDVPISGNGNYFLGVDVRSVSLGHNLIESDDTASISFKIGPGLSGDPDLRPGFDDPKKIFSQGTVETIDFTISTNGNGSPPYDYRVLLSRDATVSSDDIVLTDMTTRSGLGYIGTHYYNNTEITIPSYVPDGLYHLIVVADPLARISETQETNNTRARQVTIVSRPADANELSNIVGSHVVVETDIMETLQSYNIKSYGFMDSVDDAVKFPEHESLLLAKVMLYLSEDNIFDATDIPFQGGIEVIEGPIGEILINSTTFPIPQWIDSGDYYLFSVFDPDNVIAEDTESDNVTSGTHVTIVNNLARTVTAVNDAIDLTEGNALSVNILSNDRTSIDQEMTVLRFEGDFVGSSAPFTGKTKGGLGYSIASDGTLNLDASTLNYDLMPGEVRTESFRYELRAASDGTSDLGEITISIRDPISDTIRITPDNATAKEADGKIEFTFTRSGDRLNTEETLYVTTTQEYGSTNNSDYTSLLKQPFTFSAGEAIKTISVNILPDSVTESDESFGLIVQTNPTDPSSTFLTSSTFTIQNSIATITKPAGVTPVGDEILVDTATKNDQSGPEVTALLNGGFVVAWKDISDIAIKAQVYTSAGSRLGNVILVNTATQIDKSIPQITALPDGGFVITWKDGMPGIGGASGDFSYGAIKAQVFNADGGKVNGEILVNTATQDDQSNPQITTLPGGGFVITWMDYSHGTGGASGDSSDTAIKAQVFTADGNKSGSEILVNTATQNTQWEPQISALRNGGFAITWLDESQGIGGASGDFSGRSIKAQAFSVNGSKIGDEILVNSATQNSQDVTQITALSNGGFVITWNDFSEGVGGTSGDFSGGSIKAQVFTADGSKVGNEILANTATQNGQHDTQITTLPSGGFVITWVDYSHGIGGASGDSSDTAIKAQVFTADSSKLGGEILVNTATQNDQWRPQITALPDGGFVITWIDYSHGIGGASGDSSDMAIKAQTFTADGSKLGGEILVNTATQNDQRNPQTAALPDGGFVVTWEDNSQDAGNTANIFSIFGFAIKAQVFNVNIDVPATPDRLFNWAESAFDSLFPNHTVSQEVEGFYARIYENGNILGELNDNIYFYDGTAITINLVGTIDDFLPDSISAGF